MAMRLMFVRSVVLCWYTALRLKHRWKSELAAQWAAIFPSFCVLLFKLLKLLRHLEVSYLVFCSLQEDQNPAPAAGNHTSTIYFTPTASNTQTTTRPIAGCVAIFIATAVFVVLLRQRKLRQCRGTQQDGTEVDGKAQLHTDPVDPIKYKAELHIDRNFKTHDIDAVFQKIAPELPVSEEVKLQIDFADTHEGNEAPAQHNILEGVDGG
ncbi:hypothetical protein BJ878DRAFT_563015 [Calycina marina]|uniref:Uncharacterized protein n=1 Tax=Calycina marina TaxID=1763456 RepID=A0A9P7Z6G6_9HELO|nr:hypothetical protein BJ878DRAFT_563015 [Calycina marina]